MAITLVAIGFMRFVTDTLHEHDARYWEALADSPLRYLVRAPSDGTWLGYANAQWFKVLAVPAGLSLIYLRSFFAVGDPAENEREFRDWAVRGVWIAMFFTGFTLIELQKQFAFLPFSTCLVAGERPMVNHIAHLVGVALAWWLSEVLGLEDRRSGPRPS